MKDSPYQLWRARLARYKKVETLVAAAAVVAGLIVVLKLCEQIGSGLVTHDAASRFASALRSAQAQARNRNAFIRVTAVPAAPGRASVYRVQAGADILAEEPIHGGASASGTVTLDPQGIPIAPACFKVRMGSRQTLVEISAKGVVSIP